MKKWTESAMRSYYLDPEIVFLDAGHRHQERIATEKGYYVSPHCDPDCCQAFGKVSKVDLGPFPTAAKARQWSAENMVPIQ